MPDPQTVLMVDDDREIVRAAVLRLRSAGYEVLAVNDAESGIDTAATRHPDVILLDVRLPHQDGIMALANLKRRPDTKDIPVVMLSASIADQQAALDAGARLFVKKPYGGDMLVQAVRTAIATNVRNENEGWLPWQRCFNSNLTPRCTNTELPSMVVGSGM